jgi:hypothetical protein
MKVRVLRRLFAALIPIFIFSFFAFFSSATTLVEAQDLDDVTITGRVTDVNGAIVPGATITAIFVETNEERSANANDDGVYRLIELKPGLYTVRASNAGFATEEKQNLTTIAGQNVKIDFALRPADITAEQVIVDQADVPAVDTTRTVVGGTVVTEEIESLPNSSRSPIDLVFTLGGVTEEPLSTRDLAEDRNSSSSNTPEEAGLFALAGGPAYSNNITIDGLDNNDDRAARERFQPSLDAVEEVQVITNQFSAEYGRASGGRLNIRTRAGSKRFRGRAFMFFRDDFFNANTFRNNLNGLTRLPLTEYNPGFTLSGPLNIWPKAIFGRGQTFIFVSFEHNKLLDAANIDTLVPVLQNPDFPLPVPTLLSGRRPETTGVNSDPAELAPFFSGISTPSTNTTFTVRIDRNFGDSHNGTLSYQMGRQDNLRGFSGGNRLAETLVGRTRNSDAISYSDNLIFSAKAVNQARFQFSMLTPAVRSERANSPVVIIDLNDPAATGSLVAGASTLGATDREEQRIQFQDTFSYIAGSHSLKFGGDVQRIRSTFIDLADASGTFNFESAGDFLAGIVTRYRQNFQTESTQQNVYMGIFFQDEWRIRSNFTLSYGVRYERETILPDDNNFGPRFAIAYDPFKSGKTVIRVGAGIFYNRVLLRTVDDYTLGNQQFFFDTNLIPTTQRAQFISDNIRFPTTFTADSPVVQQFISRDSDTFSRRLDPDLRIPESYQANIGFEREISKSFVFEANYTWNRGIHLWREFNANAPRLPSGFNNFTEFLLSRDFPNFRPCAGCSRPIFNGTNAGELVRFIAGAPDPANPNNPNNAGRVVELGLPVSILSVNSTGSTNVNAALSALNFLRPDPTRTQIEQLVSIGNSFYHGLTLELRRRFRRSRNGLSFSFRAAYTLSSLKDDGIVNTSSALVPGDFARELSRSILDRRHRFVFSGTFDLPSYLGKLRISPIFRTATGAPFNISLGGTDRNLDDVGTDRPNFSGNLDQIRSRRPSDPIDPGLLTAFTQPAIGQIGNLGRNAGLGPGHYLFDLNVQREFRLGERVRLRPTLEIDNVLNHTAFSFGSEFINFSSLSPTSTAATRQNFIDNFLVTTRTFRPRQFRFGIRLDF